MHFRRYLFLITAILLTTSLFLIGLPSLTYAVDGSRGDKKGGHNQQVVGFKRLVCTSCHFSAADQGQLIWATLPKGAQTIPNSSGVKTICSSCHYPGNAVNALSGFVVGQHEEKGHTFQNGNVLSDNTLSGRGENHVMTLQVNLDPNTGKLPASLNSAFPLKKADDQAGQEQASQDLGFTCTSCHNPHDQPKKDESGLGDYLRLAGEHTPGTSNARTPFCLQCHLHGPQGAKTQKEMHGQDQGCNDCHHPHDGYYQAEQQPHLSRTILWAKVPSASFVALPNVTGFASSSIEQAPEGDPSFLCYGCHGAKAKEEIREAGAKSLYGDDWDTPHEHHPMGSQAQLGASPRAPGLASATLNAQGQVTCISCHNGFHRGKNPRFLREDITNDNPTLCTLCHNDKKDTDLGLPGQAHHQLAKESPNQRGKCLFCHFMHDGQDRGEQPKPSIEVLLRVEPVNLAWSDQAENTSADDFEDLCFGCHSSKTYMKGSGQAGALLQPDHFSGHRFSSIPSAWINTSLPISDGEGEKTLNDYGTTEGAIFCGSCHNIHQSANSPYLRGKDSPYTKSTFCTGCHSEFPAGGRSSHPVDVPPKPTLTRATLPESVYGGKSGIGRGITSDETSGGRILCLTCHSVHSAYTTIKGQLASDNPKAATNGKHGKLLVMDNYSSTSGSDLCRSCHVQFTNIAASRHDFAILDLGSPRSFGVCSSCHLVHGSLEDDLLWSRSLSEERELYSQNKKPNYCKGATIYCYDCHDDHFTADDDPSLSTFLYSPLDIAFTDGPGKNSKVGFYETIPPGNLGDNGISNPPTNGTSTGGHFIKTSGLTENTHGIATGDKIPCNLCHNPHQVTDNEVFFCPPPEVRSPGNLKASTNTRYGTGEGREMCASCHGYAEENRLSKTSARFFEIDISETPSKDSLGRDTPKAHQENASSTPCTECHVHNRLTGPTAPKSGPGTHIYHFTSLLSEGEGSILSARSLLVSEKTERNCDICHTPDLQFKGGKLVFQDGETLEQTTVCNPCHSPEGQYDGVNGKVLSIIDRDYGAKDCWENGVYEEITDSEGQTEKRLRTGKEGWCVGCHDDQPSMIKNNDHPEHLWVKAPNIVGGEGDLYGFYSTGHGLPSNFAYKISGKSGAGLICTDCHSASKTHIVNKERGKGNYLPWLNNGFRLKLPLTLPRRSEEYYSSDFELCFSCHEEALVVGLPPGYRDFTNNHNPDVNLSIQKYLPKQFTNFRNTDPRGLYPLKTMGRGIKIDFSILYPNNSYNIHWNHLALPNADLPPEAVISPQAQQSSSTIQRTQTCYSDRCHGGTGLAKVRPNSFWDSDRDGLLDSRPSCIACHNPHGSRYVSMTRNDLGITHNPENHEWEYGRINSKEYGAFDDSLDNYNDLYCGECHAQLQRSGSSVIFYPKPPTDDLLAPGSPL